MESTPLDDISRHLSFGVEDLDGRTERKTIYLISDEDIDGFDSLGRASAQFVGLAIHMAFRHVQHFFQRVAGYRLTDSPEADVMEEAFGRHYDTIEFFEVKR
jgi:hypothetical protein